MRPLLIVFLLDLAISFADSLLCFDGSADQGVVVRPVDYRFQCFNITNKPDANGQPQDHYMTAIPILYEGVFVDVGKCVKAPYANNSQMCACDTDYCNCPKCKKEKPTADLEWWEQRFETTPKPKTKPTAKP